MDYRQTGTLHTGLNAQSPYTKGHDIRLRNHTTCKGHFWALFFKSLILIKMAGFFVWNMTPSKYKAQRIFDMSFFHRTANCARIADMVDYQ